MADQDGGETSSSIPNPFESLLAQMTGMTRQMANLSGLTSSTPAAQVPGAQALPSLARPADLSAGQLKAVASAVAAQRRSIEAMRAQLQAFDEQLEVLEKILAPMTEWTTAWADLEKKVMGAPPPAKDD